MSVMTSRQAAELDHALERNNLSSADVKKMSEGDVLSYFLLVLNGEAEIIRKKHIIDCDADPYVPDNWEEVEHRKGGKLEFDPQKIEFYLAKNQREKNREGGHDLRKILADKPVLNANTLDYLLANPYLIPEDSKGKFVFFWGTIYRNSDGNLYVRYLRWSGGRWGWGYHWLDDNWRDFSPAALLAS